MSPTAARHRRLGVAAVITMLLALLVSCAGSDSPTTRGLSSDARPSTTVEYASGLSEDIYLPAGKGRVPLVVLVPGGSWTTADPTGLAGLAAALAEAGVAAAPTHIRAADDGVVYPAPVEDVLCAVAAAAERLHSRGFVPDPVAVLGHSSGAHLAALAVLAVDDYSPDCGSPPVTPDALVGLSGPYDISQLPDVAASLLGTSPDDDPAAWASANPVARAALRPDVPVLLIHGEDDTTVAPAFTSQFAQALEDAGHPTTVQMVPGADHQTIYRGDVASDRVAQWLLALPRASDKPRS
ncbi:MULTISPECIES: alpha/beta hydrolase family protein [unclassified Nocardioides]|uniref:alpha/beta hydrolase family protein n=1 Tax=unclassified Nocardioides TaxID=2615069 RepID=UPI0013FD6122|nr:MULTISPECIES: prolyl oligopeptidase family serine peptidase [unclassified Nocardioides]